MFGIGGFAEKGYERGRKNRFYTTKLGFNFFIPKSITTDETAYALGNMIQPQSIDVTKTTKISLIAINLDEKMYFGGGNMEDGGFYGGLGAGAWLATETDSYSSYDNSSYSITGYDNITTPQHFFQFMIRGTIGFEKSFDKLGVFGEAVLNVPATNVNGVSSEISLPVSVGVQAGIRYNLN